MYSKESVERAIKRPIMVADIDDDDVSTLQETQPRSTLNVLQLVNVAGVSENLDDTATSGELGLAK